VEQFSRSFTSIALAIFLACCVSVRSARAAGEVTLADLQAAAGALGFLDSIPHDGAIVVAILYAPQSPDSKAQALQAAGVLNTLPGPNKTVFRTKIISMEELAQSSDRLDAIFLLPGLSAEAAAIINAVRRRHLVSISNDPACLDANCCVLMVRASHGVEIVLHTGLAAAVGANFSTVFTMLVKRR